MNCRTMGHNWQSTTSNTVRICSTCKKTQIHVQGVWIDSSKQERSKKVVIPAEQMRLL